MLHGESESEGQRTHISLVVLQIQTRVVRKVYPVREGITSERCNERVFSQGNTLLSWPNRHLGVTPWCKYTPGHLDEDTHRSLSPRLLAGLIVPHQTTMQSNASHPTLTMAGSLKWSEFSVFRGHQRLHLPPAAPLTRCKP